MQQIEFLNAVLPPKGSVYVLWAAKSGKSKQLPFQSTDDLLAHAMLLDSEGWDVYFALATFADPNFIDTKGKKRLRVQDNVAAVRAFWFDMDCGPGKDYAGIPEANEALREFCNAVSLPRPTTVISGGGLHVYWPLTSAVAGTTWTAVATALKTLAKSLGLRADPARTADSASILRIPGTNNYKKGTARPVRLVYSAPATPIEKFEASVNGALATLGVAAPASTEADTLLQLLGPSNLSGLKDLRADGDYVVSKCAQLAFVQSVGGDVPQPLWYHALQVARFFVDSERWFYEFTTGYAGWSEDELRTKLAQLEDKGVGPTLCTTLEADNPGKCDGCPFRGKVASPASIRGARVVAEAPAPSAVLPVPAVSEPMVEVAADEASILAFGFGGSSEDRDVLAEEADSDLPKPPYPFVRGESGGLWAVKTKKKAANKKKAAKKSESDDGEPSDDEDTDEGPVKFYDYDLYPVDLHVDVQTMEHVCKFVHSKPHEGYKAFEFPRKLFADKRNALIELAALGISPSGDAHKALLVTYMNGYINELEKKRKAHRMYSQLGWCGEDNEQFIIGNRLVSEDRVEEISARADMAATAGKFTKAGDFEAWKRVVAMYERPEYVEQAFAFMTAFGAPLMQFTPYDGAIVSLTGDSGSGKSTVLQMINSVWGEPKNWLLEGDTNNARLAKVGQIKNLPVTFDEITNIDPRVLSAFCYQITNGRAKDRLDRSARLRENSNTWRTILTVTTNVSLMIKLAAGDTDGEAESKRVFEIYMMHKGLMSPQEANAAFAPVLSNYGHAGEIYAQYLVKHRRELRNALEKTHDKFSAKAQSSSNERFWSWVVACNLVGATIAQVLGIHKIDTRRLFDWAVGHVGGMRQVVASNKQSPEALLAAFLADNVSNRGAILGGRVDTSPSLKVLAAVEDRMTGKTYIRTDLFRSFCREHAQDFNLVKKALTSAGLFIGEEQRNIHSPTGQGNPKCPCLVARLSVSAAQPVSSDNVTPIRSKQ